jgi:hypothetical protein
MVFTVHEHGYKQCSDDPVGTYITPVPNFLEGYLKYYTQIQQDKGYEDYELPDAATYTYCTRTVVNNQEYYLQMGCSDSSSQALAVNIYSDNTCTTRSTADGSHDDANIDVSEIQVSRDLSVCLGGVGDPNSNSLLPSSNHSLLSGTAKLVSCGSTKMMTQSMICTMKTAKLGHLFVPLPGTTRPNAKANAKDWGCSGKRMAGALLTRSCWPFFQFSALECL